MWSQALTEESTQKVGKGSHIAASAVVVKRISGNERIFLLRCICGPQELALAAQIIVLQYWQYRMEKR